MNFRDVKAAGSQMLRYEFVFYLSGLVDFCLIWELVLE